MTPQRIIWHHSADVSSDPQFEKIDRYHKKQSFPKSSMGYFVGYHYLIEYDGTIKQARAESEIGAHDAGENPNSLGICLTGDFNILMPTEAQAISAALLVGQIRSRWNIPVTRIEPHRWDDTTDCPGKLLPDNWLVKEYLKRDASPLIRFFQQVGEYFKLL